MLGSAEVGVRDTGGWNGVGSRGRWGSPSTWCRLDGPLSGRKDCTKNRGRPTPAGCGWERGEAWWVVYVRVDSGEGPRREGKVDELGPSKGLEDCDGGPSGRTRLRAGGAVGGVCRPGNRSRHRRDGVPRRKSLTGAPEKVEVQRSWCSLQNYSVLTSSQFSNTDVSFDVSRNIVEIITNSFEPSLVLQEVVHSPICLTRCRAISL